MINKSHLAMVSKAAGVLIPLVFGVVCVKLLSPYLPNFARWVDTLGVWGPAVFVLTYVVGVVLMWPVFLLIVAGGAVFGVIKGALLAMTGAMVGGFFAFLIARHLLRDQVTRRIAKHPKLSALDRIVGEDGRRLVFFLRLSPAIPFVLSNYALGVTKVRLKDFVIGTLGLAPIVISYAAFGSAAGTSGVGANGKPTMSTPLIALSVAATIALGWVMTRIAQKAIAEAEAKAP